LGAAHPGHRGDQVRTLAHADAQARDYLKSLLGIDTTDIHVTVVPDLSGLADEAREVPHGVAKGLVEAGELEADPPAGVENAGFLARRARGRARPDRDWVGSRDGTARAGSGCSHRLRV
jgi:hypothetical protein